MNSVEEACNYYNLMQFNNIYQCYSFSTWTLSVGRLEGHIIRDVKNPLKQFPKNLSETQATWINFRKVW